MDETRTLAVVECEAIRKALKAHDWNIRQTALALGCSRKGLYLKMKTHGIQRPTR